jgi:hypothetical protein
MRILTKREGSIINAFIRILPKNRTYPAMKQLIVRRIRMMQTA